MLRRAVYTAGGVVSFAHGPREGRNENTDRAQDKNLYGTAKTRIAREAASAYRRNKPETQAGVIVGSKSKGGC